MGIITSNVATIDMPSMVSSDLCRHSPELWRHDIYDGTYLCKNSMRLKQEDCLLAAVGRYRSNYSGSVFETPGTQYPERGDIVLVFVQ